MHHADLLREATAVMSHASVSALYDTAVWYLVWMCGRVGVCLVVGWAMASVKKTRLEVFRLSFRLEEVEFSTGSARRNSQSKKVESKKPFFDCVRKPNLGFSRKRPFSTDKSDVRLRKKAQFGLQSKKAVFD